MGARSEIYRAVIAAIAVAAAGAALVVLEATRAFERPASDALIRLASAYPPAGTPGTPDVAIVSIDAQSLRAHPDWPWSRARHAQVVERLTRAGARVIAFDVDFSTPRDPAGDALFAAAIRRSGRVVLAAFRQLEPAAGGLGQVEVASLPLPELAAEAAAIGSVIMPIDPDGVLRRAPYASPIAGRRLPSLAAAAWTIGMGTRPAVPSREDFLVDYRRVRPAIPVIPIAEVLAGSFDPAAVADRVVFIGAAAAELQDRWPTPLTPVEPGVAIQAVAYRTLAAERAGQPVLRSSGKPLRIAFLALLSVLGASLGTIRHRLRVAGFAGLVTFGLGTAIALLVRWGLLVDVLAPLAVLGLHYALGVERLRLVFRRHSRQGERSLATIAEIDRAVLSVIDRFQVVQTLLRRIPELYPCDALAVAVRDPAGGPILETHVYAVGTKAQRKEACPLAAGDIEELLSRAGASYFDRGEDLPAYLAPLEAEGMQAFLVLPVVFKSDLLGIIALGHSRSLRHIPDELTQVDQIAASVGVALSNVRMFEQVSFLAYYDSLTHLPNRTLFRDRLDQALAEATRSKTGLAVLLLDLDLFKRINDTSGHIVGDQLLEAVAERIQNLLRDHDSVARGRSDQTTLDLARLGGDEFTVLVKRIRHEHDAARVASQLVSELGREFRLRSHEVTVTASIGIAVYPVDGEDSETLLKNADAAMYHAKQQGRNNFQFYKESMNETTLHQLKLEGRLRGALDRDDLYVHYQPVVDLRTGRIVGVEALARWSDSELGDVSPGDFIPVAEESGLIELLGEWVLRTACRQVRAWDAAGLDPIWVAVNLSARQFRNESLAEDVARMLEDAEIDAQRLVLEITEGVLMETSGDTRAVLDALKALGLRISIDDFGTGYSSLSYLTNFPLDHLKIDQSFVRGVDLDPDRAAITSAIVAMAKRLRLKVVAEGVETPEELAFLAREGCDEIQGYLFSRPVSAESIGEYLRCGKRLESWGEQR